MTVLVNSVSSLQCKFFTHADSISVLDKLICAQKMYLALADPRGRQGRTPPPRGPNSFIFMQFSAKI